ncbi:MAG: hypothetical protein AB7P49_00130 [Bdellovibrionales bacterium]
MSNQNGGRRIFTYVDVFGHKGCNDGHMAVALCVFQLPNLYGKDAIITVTFLNADLSDWKLGDSLGKLPEDTKHVKVERRAIFIDISPTKEHYDVLNSRYDHISVFDHHLSSAEFLRSLSKLEKWNVVHSLDHCATWLVFDSLFHPDDRDMKFAAGTVSIAKARIVVTLTDQYDVWSNPTPFTFLFSIACSIKWKEVTQPRMRTTVPQLMDFLYAVCLMDEMEVVSLSKPMWRASVFEYRTTFRFILELPTVSGKPIPVITWFGDRITNPSIGCYVLMKETTGYLVSMCLFRNERNGKVVFRASLRSQQLNLIENLDWVKGHANSCSGILPDPIVEKMLAMKASPWGF